MGAYIPFLVWLAGMAICAYIARKRNVRVTFFWNLVVVVLGPFAIPLMFLAKPRVDVTREETG
jgi:hypothetical protein